MLQRGFVSKQLRFDHAVIFVDDLTQAVTNYTALGFYVGSGGVHAGGVTENALISFADGAYLELLAPTQPLRMHVMRWLARLRLRGLPGTYFSPHLRAGILGRTGLIAFALIVAEHLDELIATLDQLGLPMTGPFPGGRVTPDGQQVVWRSAFPESSALPFLIEDVTPRVLRVPAAKEIHGNCAIGVQRIMVATADLDRTASDYRALLGRDPQPSQDPPPGAEAIDFPLGTTTITITSPRVRNAESRRHFTDLGQGPYELRLRGEAGAIPAALDPKRTWGARIVVI